MIPQMGSTNTLEVSVSQALTGELIVQHWDEADILSQPIRGSWL
jgi:hypothetical protein